MAAYGGCACEASKFCAPATLTTRPAADCGVFGRPALTQAQNVGVSGIDRYVLLVVVVVVVDLKVEVPKRFWG